MSYLIFNQRNYRMYIIIVLNVLVSSALAEYVIISGDTNVVLGGTLHLKAELFDADGNPASGKFQFNWFDNAIPKHNSSTTSSNPFSEWELSYDPDRYAPGPYNVEVDVKKNWLFGWFDLTSNRLSINVTSLLSGGVQVTQKSTLRDQYVATYTTATYNVTLYPADKEYLANKRPHILSYWFVNCEYLGGQTGFSRDFNYSKVDSTQYVEVLIIARAYPPTPPTTTTSTTTTSTTPTTTTTTTTTTTATPSTSRATTLSSITTTSGASLPHVESDELTKWLGEFSVWNGTTLGSGFCINMSSVPITPDATYGYFNKKLITKDPVKAVSINGSNWLQDGDILNLGISCNGSGPFNYCVQLAIGLYNVTGNETCEEGKAKTLSECSLSFRHLFPAPKQYTLVFIIRNSVSKLVTPMGINVYKVTKQPQLSVIIVPVVFSIIAVILIIFGVAYYIQSRRNFQVEVADFDFGQQPSELEYKTFPERLRESIMNSFFRTNDPTESESGWSPSRKYGSMQ